jgi:phage FluMu protein Com
MATIRALADFQEARCPACGAAINTGSASRKRKVQCPKCREVVEISKAEPVAAVLPDATSTRMEELEARLARLEALEARVAALEGAKAPVAIVPFPEPETVVVAEAAPTPTQSARKLRWKAPSERHRGEEIPADIQDVLLHNLGTFPPRALTLRAAADFPVEWKRAEQLKELFERANWQVSGPHHTVFRRGQGLSLAVGSLPPPADAAALHLALTASGFETEPLLDPGLAMNESVLIVA